jgi:hypothetical protein
MLYKFETKCKFKTFEIIREKNTMKKIIETKPEIGVSVKVKKNTRDTLYDRYDIGGWQGRITMYESEDGEVDDGESVIEIEYDSVTLQQMPEKYIKRYISYDYDFASEMLSLKKVEFTSPRDTEEETKAARLKICKKYGCISIIDQGNDTRLFVLHSEFQMESDGITIKDIPFFVKSLSKKTKEELLFILKKKNSKKASPGRSL